jgi:integrase
MALEIKKGSNWWYARWRDGDKIRQVRLSVPVRGRPPSSLRQEGDRAFERSRGQAMREHDRLLKELKVDRTAEKDLRDLIQLKTGHQPEFPVLRDLPRLWAEIPRRKAPTPRYVSQCQTVIERFVEFVEAEQPGIVEFAQVTPDTARAFMHAEEDRGLSPRTWNGSLNLLRRTFNKLHPFLSPGNNPFHGLVTKEEQTVNRLPFSGEELRSILRECEKDNFIRPIIVTGICTAMRRGDCCTLRWSDVNLGDGFIRVKTSKTGSTVEIPIFPLLNQELQQAVQKRGDSQHCFPDQAAMYKSNPDGITRRVKQVLAKALQKVPKGSEDNSSAQHPPREIPSEIRQYLSILPASPRNRRLKRAVRLYSSGKTMAEVARSIGVKTSSISGYLKEVETKTGCSIVRRSTSPLPMKLLQTEKEGRKRKASIRDFHSFRVTWITLALTAGVPLELVRRVSGHQTVDIVLKHYFRPDRENFRSALMKAMPEMFGSAEAKSQSSDFIDRALDELRTMDAKNWSQKRDVLIHLLSQIKSDTPTPSSGA